MSLLADLREADLARQIEWDVEKKVDLAYSAVELGGETGEALNVIKKLVRERRGIRGSRASLGDLADELADVVICVDLLAINQQLEFESADVEDDPEILAHLPRRELLAAGLALGRAVGVVLDLAEDIAVGFVNPIRLRLALSDVLAVAREIARLEGLDLDRAVRRKFNATSEKVGLSTKMLYTSGEGA